MISKYVKISILVSNYNKAKYLEECIGSLISQTIDNWELYIIDDASTDNSKEILRKYKNNSHIKIWFNEENLGYSANLKRLIKLSSNDIVGILNASDKLHETAIEKILNKYEQYYKAGFVYSNFWYCNKNLEPKKLGFCKFIPNGFTNLNSSFTSNFITFRKSVYQQTSGIDESIPFALFNDLIYKMEEVTRLHFVDEPLYYLRKIDYSISEKIQKIKDVKKSKQNAFARRGLPDRTKLLERIKNPDFDYYRKRDVRKNPPKINKKDGLENLLSAKKIFNKLGINYWLTDGTLLGYYREKDFIKHDFDLDLGCLIKDYDDKIVREFQNEGWKLYREYGKKELGFELSFERDFLKLDVFFFYEEEGRLWHGAWHKTKQGKNLIKYYYEPFGFTTGEFLGHEFTIPEDPLKYIVTKYGESWNKPVKNWDWADGPSNSVRTDIFI